MSDRCRELRGLLEAALVGPPDPSRLVPLGWGRHLGECAACRALLESEEGLETLLASLPEPRLAPDVARRVLERLRAARTTHEALAGREAALDRLLEAAGAVELPADLAPRVLVGLACERPGDPLERLLDQAGEVAVPAAWAPRVLDRLGPHRRRVARRRTLASAGAALLLVGGGALAALWLLRGPREAPGGVAGSPAPGVPALGEPDEELLAALDVLENWELVSAEDPDLAAFVGLDARHEALLDLLALEPPVDEDALEPIELRADDRRDR